MEGHSHLSASQQTLGGRSMSQQSTRTTTTVSNVKIHVHLIPEGVEVARVWKIDRPVIVAPGTDVRAANRECEEHIMEHCKLLPEGSELNLHKVEQIAPGGQPMRVRGEDVGLEAGQTYEFNYKVRLPEPVPPHEAAEGEEETGGGGPTDGAKWEQMFKRCAELEKEMREMKVWKNGMDDLEKKRVEPLETAEERTKAAVRLGALKEAVDLGRRPRDALSKADYDAVETLIKWGGAMFSRVCADADAQFEPGTEFFAKICDFLEGTPNPQQMVELVDIQLPTGKFFEFPKNLGEQKKDAVDNDGNTGDGYIIQNKHPQKQRFFVQLTRCDTGITGFRIMRAAWPSSLEGPPDRTHPISTQMEYVRAEQAKMKSQFDSDHKLMKRVELLRPVKCMEIHVPKDCSPEEGTCRQFILHGEGTVELLRITIGHTISDFKLKQYIRHIICSSYQNVDAVPSLRFHAMAEPIFGSKEYLVDIVKENSAIQPWELFECHFATANANKWTFIRVHHCNGQLTIKREICSSAILPLFVTLFKLSHVKGGRNFTLNEEALHVTLLTGDVAGQIVLGEDVQLPILLKIDQGVSSASIFEFAKCFGAFGCQKLQLAKKHCTELDPDGWLPGRVCHMLRNTPTPENCLGELVLEYTPETPFKWPLTPMKLKSTHGEQNKVVYELVNTETKIVFEITIVCPGSLHINQNKAGIHFTSKRMDK